MSLRPSNNDTINPVDEYHATGTFETSSSVSIVGLGTHVGNRYIRRILLHLVCTGGESCTGDAPGSSSVFVVGVDVAPVSPISDAAVVINDFHVDQSRSVHRRFRVLSSERYSAASVQTRSTPVVFNVQTGACIMDAVVGRPGLLCDAGVALFLAHVSDKQLSVAYSLRVQFSA
jgi:hypothetical protein